LAPFAVKYQYRIKNHQPSPLERLHFRLICRINKREGKQVTAAQQTAQPRDLDLHFEPVPPRTTRRLTRAQIDLYNRQGFVQPFRVFDDSEMTGIRAYLDGLMADTGEAGAYGVNCYQARVPLLTLDMGFLPPLMWSSVKP
jgi:hypothetical protein